MSNSPFIQIWFKNLRIQSFAISACPVILATAMAFGDGVYDFKKAAICLVAMVICHILADMFKSYFDYKFFFEDILSFIVLGPVSVSATYYFQSNEMNYAIILSGISVGLLTSSIITLNNIKDIEDDKANHLKTLATIFDKSVEQLIYAFLITLGLLLPTAIYLLINDHVYILLCSVLIIFCIPVFKKVFSESDLGFYNPAIVSTERILILFTIIYSIGWII